MRAPVALRPARTADRCRARRSTVLSRFCHRCNSARLIGHTPPRPGSRRRPLDIRRQNQRCKTGNAVYLAALINRESEVWLLHCSTLSLTRRRRRSRCRRAAVDRLCRSQVCSPGNW